MSTLLGCIRDETAHNDEAWRRALGRMASRSGPATELTASAGVHVAFGGADPSAYAESEAWTVTLDGFIDGAPAGNVAAELLAQIEREGIGAIEKRTGSFALAAVDRKNRRAYLVRDRFGTRPLHYARCEGGYSWASEVKCLAPLIPSLETETDVLGEIFHYRWLAGPKTLMRGALQVLPGHVVVLRQDSVEPRRYWRAGIEPRPSGDFEDSVERAGETLMDYLRDLSRRFPRVGIPLSAGVDSPLLAAMAKRAGFSDCITVSARYPGWENPELEPAALSAKHLGLEHRVVDIEPDYIAKQFKPLLWRLEEPARHYHIFPLNRILDELSPRVDLVLYGEGADTIFGTIDAVNLRKFAARHARLQPIPPLLRGWLGAAARRVGSRRAKHLADLLQLTPRDYLYGLSALKHGTDPSEVIYNVGREIGPNRETLDTFLPPGADLTSELQTLNLYTEVKCHLDTMDRLSAPTGMQVAVPFLSAPILDMARTLPLSHKSKDSYSKPILRELGARYFPRQWMYRPKYGFETPTEAWLRGPLRPYLDSLRDARTQARGLYRAGALERLSLDNDWELLWTAVCLETILRMFLDGEEPSG